MKKRINSIIRFFFMCLFSITAMGFGGIHAQCWASETIKVGIFQNKPIVYYEDGPKGLFVEVLDYVAKKENWEIEYVQCELKECLELLDSNRLDIMTSLGVTPKRSAIYSFSKEPIWTFWGTVYSHDPTIKGIFDLHGKNIGIRKGNKITKALQDMLSKFNIPVEYSEYDNYELAYEAFKNKKLDAIAVNNTYGFDKYAEISAHKTPIVFHPFSAYFAAPVNGRHTDKLATIDNYVRLLKADDNSLLQAFNSKWFGQHQKGLLNVKNIGIASAVLLFLTICAMVTWRHLSIMKINANLYKNIEERKRAESALQRAHSELENRVKERTENLSKEIENRKILENELSREKTFLEAVLNNIEDGIVACNQDGVLTLFNRATREFHGLPEKPIPAEEWADYYDLYLADGITKMAKQDIPLFRALHGEILNNIEMVIAPKKGTKRIMLAAGQPLIDNSNNLLGAVASMHDITDQKNAERMLSKAHQELEKKVEERTAELMLSLENLEKETAAREKIESKLQQSQKMEAIGTLAGGIAHDFNNILSVIFGYSELAEDVVDTDPQIAKNHIAEALKAAGRAKNLVNQILTFSRKAEHEKKPLKMSLVAKEALKLLRSSIPTTIEIQQDLTSDAVVLADPTKIHQIIINLCTNAYHAMHDTGGTLLISMKDVDIREEEMSISSLIPPGNYLMLEVSDNGTGMDAETTSQIFNPYFTTKGAGEGTGLGLAVVHGIVEDHNGFIKVYSEPGQGTSFHLYFPIIKEKAEKYLTEQNAINIKGGNERIMVVDDEEQITSFAASMLARYGYEVTTFPNGVQALQEIKKQPDLFDLIITDLTMPHMTGIELTEKILAINPRIPVILNSGFSDNLSREKAKKAGVKEYCQKPIVSSELLLIIRKLLDAP